eukprot:213426-Hanusia_phi.AAC.2
MTFKYGRLPGRNSVRLGPEGFISDFWHGAPRLSGADQAGWSYKVLAAGGGVTTVMRPLGRRGAAFADGGKVTTFEYRSVRRSLSVQALVVETVRVI